MSGRWELNAVERVVLFAGLFIQWTLTVLVAIAVVDEHGTYTAADAQAFDYAYWLLIGIFAAALLLYPAASLVVKYGPQAYTYIKTKVDS